MSDVTTTDLYEVTMALSYLRKDMRDMRAPATFRLFVRDLPPGRGFLVAARLEPALDFPSEYRVERSDVGRRTSGSSRPRGIARSGTSNLSSVRRMHGPWAGTQAACLGAMVGFAGTSNVAAATALGIPASGTMAHSYIETFTGEEEAFRAFARCHPGPSHLARGHLRHRGGRGSRGTCPAQPPARTRLRDPCKPVYRRAGHPDVVALSWEEPPDSARPLLRTVMHGGRRTGPPDRRQHARERFREDTDALPASVRRIHDPEPVRANGSRALEELTTRFRSEIEARIPSTGVAAVPHREGEGAMGTPRIHAESHRAAPRTEPTPSRTSVCARAGDETVGHGHRRTVGARHSQAGHGHVRTE
jgi:hypothetical protein